MPTLPPARSAAPRPLVVWTALVVVYLVWGSTYLGIRVAVETLPPLVMAAVRFLVAGSILFVAASLTGSGPNDRRPSLRDWRDATIGGGLLLLGGMGLVAVGEQTVASGITALLVALMPLWLAVIGRTFFRQRLAAPVLAGIALGLAGVAVLAWPAGPERLDPGGLAAIIVSPISWATGTLFLAHRAQTPRRASMATSLQMLAGGALLGVAAIVTGELGAFRPDRVTGQSLLALGYLTTVGSLLAFSVYGWLIRNAPLSLVGTYAYVNPIVAVILGAILLGEPVSMRTLVAAILIIAAVAITVSVRRASGRPVRSVRRDGAATGATGVPVRSGAPPARLAGRPAEYPEP